MSLFRKTQRETVKKNKQLFIEVCKEKGMTKKEAEIMLALILEKGKNAEKGEKEDA